MGATARAPSVYLQVMHPERLRVFLALAAGVAGESPDEGPTVEAEETDIWAWGDGW